MSEAGVPRTGAPVHLYALITPVVQPYSGTYNGSVGCRSVSLGLRAGERLNRVGGVGGALERSHDFLGALEAFRLRVPDLTDQVLRSTVALGRLCYLLLFSRELYAPQVILERAYVEVTLVHMLSPSSA